MHIQIVTFSLKGITDAEYVCACEKEFAPAFRHVPDLLSKTWLRNPATNTYGGVYVWRNEAAMDQYIASDLFQSIVNHPSLVAVRSQNFEVLEGMAAGPFSPDPFGFAAVAEDLASAKQFYQRFYPWQVVEGVFAGIRYLSIMKDGATLVNVFEKSENNPIHGTIPILRVPSVREYVTNLQDAGGSVIIPQATCPCTHTSFAVCADPAGNQFMFKEA